MINGAWGGRANQDGSDGSQPLAEHCQNLPVETREGAIPAGGGSSATGPDSCGAGPLACGRAQACVAQLSPSRRGRRLLQLRSDRDHQRPLRPSTAASRTAHTRNRHTTPTQTPNRCPRKVTTPPCCGGTVCATSRPAAEATAIPSDRDPRLVAGRYGRKDHRGLRPRPAPASWRTSVGLDAARGPSALRGGPAGGAAMGWTPGLAPLLPFNQGRPPRRGHSPSRRGLRAQGAVRAGIGVWRDKLAEAGTRAGRPASREGRPRRSRPLWQERLTHRAPTPPVARRDDENRRAVTRRRDRRRLPRDGVRAAVGEDRNLPAARARLENGSRSFLAPWRWPAAFALGLAGRSTPPTAATAPASTRSPPGHRPLRAAGGGDGHRRLTCTTTLVGSEIRGPTSAIAGAGRIASFPPQRLAACRRADISLDRGMAARRRDRSCRRPAHLDRIGYDAPLRARDLSRATGGRATRRGGRHRQSPAAARWWAARAVRGVGDARSVPA